MPFVNEDAMGLGVPVLPPTAIPEAKPVAPAAPPEPEHSALDVAASALRQSNILSSLYSRASNGGYGDIPPQAGYSPYDSDAKEITGYDPEKFVHSQSPAETQAIKNQLDEEERDRRTLAGAGGVGYAASMAAGVVDPITLTSMLIPGLEEVSVARMAKIGVTVATNVAAGEAQAAALAANQQDGDYKEGILPRIGVNALLSGVLGAVATRVPKAEFDKAAAATREDLARTIPEGSTAGAAEVAKTTLEQESISKGGQKIAETMGRVSPSARVMASSPEVESRRLIQRLVDVPFMLKKNEEGIATPASIEMKVNQKHNMRQYQSIQEADAQFAEYKQEGGTLSRRQFDHEVVVAMNSEDKHAIKQVAALSSWQRPMFDADRAALKEVGALPEEFELLGDKSYFPRVYDQHAIKTRQTEFESILREHYTNNPIMSEPKTPEEQPRPIHQEPAEIDAAVRDTIDNITGMVRGTADIGRSLTKPSPMKARRLDIPFHKIKDFLSTDFEHVMAAYNHTLLPQIEMRKMFGSVDLATEFQQIGDAYRQKIARAGDNDALKAKLYEQQAQDIKDLTLVRDRLLGQVGPRGDQSRAMVRAAQLLRTYSYVRMLGGQLLSSFSDWGRLVTRYGLLNTAGRTTQLLSGFSGGLMKADAQKMATALDVVLHTRQTTLEGVGNELAGSDKLARVAKNQANFFTKVSGIASWDAMMRTLSAQLEQDAIHGVIMGKPSEYELAKLANHGLDAKTLKAVKAQWEKYGSNENGLNRARTELWDNQEAAAAIEQAVQRAGSSNAFFVGKGDMPGFANSEMGKMMVQFKSFAISSVNRMVIPLAQGLARKDLHAVNGLASMLALGAMTYYTKELAAGRKPDLSPDRLIPEMVQRSGILGYLPDIYDPVAATFHLPRFSKFKDLDLAEAVGGASFGTAENTLQVIQRMMDGQVTAADMHKLRQLIPYQNLFYFNRLINILEGKAADAADAKGATGKDALDYLNPAQDTELPNKEDKKHLLGVGAIPNAF